MNAKNKAVKRRAQLPLPEKYAESGSEDAHQISLFMWAAHPDTQKKYPELKRMFHIPNGGFRRRSEASRLKAMGVKRGVCDICLPVPRGDWPILFIELKKPANKVTRKREGKTQTEQTDWIDYFKSVGYGAIICIGWEKARDTIIAYLEWRKEDDKTS